MFTFRSSGPSLLTSLMQFSVFLVLVFSKQHQATMSSLAATQADGYYIPSSYYESGAYKKKSVSQHAGSKGHNQFLTRSVCRFELPYDGFCTECNAIVGKGTRFNAHKAHVDDYFTSKIYEFTTKCRACAKCEFKIRTNPKEQSFDYVSGIRKKIEEFDSAEAGALGVIDTDVGAGIYQYKNGKVVGADDNGEDVALHSLEKTARGERKAMTEYEQMESLYRINSKMEEDADANAVLRSEYRKERKAKKRRFEDAKKIGLGRGISLAGETEQDVEVARVTMGFRDHAREQNQAYGYEKQKFSSIRSGSIFSEPKQSSHQRSKRRPRSDKRRSKCSKDEATTTAAAEASVSASRTKRKIIVCSQNIKNGTEMEVKEMAPNSCTDAISALADYGSESD